MQCGVSASLHALMNNMSAMSNATSLATSPDEMLVGLLQGRAQYDLSQFVKRHFYSLGGAIATGRWLRALVDGFFALSPRGGKFIVAM